MAIDVFENVQTKKVILNRTDEAGVVFLTCEEKPDLFIAAQGDDSRIRLYIDQGVKRLFESLDTKDVSVYTNGSLDGPKINVVVEIRP